MNVNERKIAIMQPYFFPYIGYWQLMNWSDIFVIYDDVSYIKGGWINRNRVLVNNEPKYINLKLNGASSNKLINEINIANDKVFRSKTLKTISISYGKAPWFSDVFPLLERIILSEEINLTEYLFNSFRIISEFLGIKTQFILSSQLDIDSHLKSQKRVLNICQQLDGDIYVNPEGGMSLYDKQIFKDHNITLNFISSYLPEYKQFQKPFIPGLSIIDVMMFNSVEEIRNMLEEYKLI